MNIASEKRIGSNYKIRCWMSNNITTVLNDWENNTIFEGGMSTMFIAYSERIKTSVRSPSSNGKPEF
jgi:hypothetical protein